MDGDIPDAWAGAGEPPSIPSRQTAPGPQIVIGSKDDRLVGLDDLLFAKRKLYLFGDVDEHSAARLVLGLHALAAIDPHADITLYIDSPGGICTSGMAILEAMDGVTCDIRTVCIGQAASMAAIIFAHGTKGKREVGTHSRVLIHQPHGGALGTTTHQEVTVAENARQRVQSARILAADTGQTPEDVESDFSEDLWMNPEQAIEYGLADKVMAPNRLGMIQVGTNPPSVRAAEVLATRAAQRALITATEMVAPASPTDSGAPEVAA